MSMNNALRRFKVFDKAEHDDILENCSKILRKHYKKNKKHPHYLAELRIHFEFMKDLIILQNKELRKTVKNKS